MCCVQMDGAGSNVLEVKRVYLKAESYITFMQTIVLNNVVHTQMHKRLNSCSLPLTSCRLVWRN